MKKFEKEFAMILENAIDPAAEEAAMVASLDKDTDAGEFDVDVELSEGENEHAEMNARVAAAKSEQAAAMVQTIEGWVAEFSEFLELLNGTSDGSIQSQLANSEADTILDRMKQSEQRKIARVATELAALTESFKGYLAQSENSSFKYV